MRFLLVTLVCLALCPEAYAATRVDLVLNEVQPRTVPWPVTTGVPFPRGKLPAAANSMATPPVAAAWPL